MGFRATIAWLVVLICGCYSPQLTHCPDVDCPSNEVCDNHGGCAFPQQLAPCVGQADATSCAYTDQTGKPIDGTCQAGLCVPLACGDGVLTSDEVCDDGNNLSGDGCSADCKSLEVCGNGITDSAKGEQCDDGNTTDGDGCQHDCKLPRCGDGVTDTNLDEQCDAGGSNSDTPDSPCRTNCQLPRCGDHIVDVTNGEVCDDGNNASADGCSGDCKSNESCGNGIVDALAGEVCDDGNTIGGDGCSADCRSIEVCGNGVVDSGLGEVCDDGNTVSGDGCSSDCKSKEVCGNGIVDTIDEQCDLGGANSDLPDHPCRTTCKLQACGDGILDPGHGEHCDNGVANSTLPDACRPNCELPRCGDGIQDSTEVCDDGNTTNGDGCSSDCHSLETCGNGIIDTAKGEQCDNGGANANAPNATCRLDCTRQKCGDSIVDNVFGELCDNGSANSNLPNAACRVNCTPLRCGDGIQDTGEVCDDGNVVSGDGCSADCKSKETCGNGIIDLAKGEQCDAGSANSNAANAPCRLNCKLPACGDSITDTALGEQCDAGSANSNSPDAACRTNCQLQRCGDRIVDVTHSEVCDDGNNLAGDGCSADCKSNETCGNKIVDAITGEQCDAGSGNSNAPNAACRPTCKLPVCGDAITDTVLGEACDLGTNNSNLPNMTCRTNCQPQRCGDRIVDNTKGEQCDDGNVTAGDGCSADCRSNETCGNGVIDVVNNEQCDNGGLDSNLPNATCRTTCVRQKCGDSIVDDAFGEQCDLGVANSDLPNQQCRSNCTLARCGDHIVDTTAGEVCDDGNNVSGDNCSGDCKSNETCGNGIVDAAKGEQCDDKNSINNDGCHNDCTLPKCGDGILDFNEQCDAGSANSNAPNATCRTNCTPARCGDGIIDTARGEVCDDSNTTAGDGCSADCTSKETCGNGVVDLVKGEECDDGNTRGRDGCSACKIERAVAVQPGGAPSGRISAAFVYDAGRQRVVMFGGYTANGELNETWEWDGTSWTQMFPAHSPLPRFDAAAAYDPVRHRIVMFGGFSLNYGGALQDTWEYDGVDWTQKSPTTLPTDRAGAAMAYDAVNGKMVMFGGAIGFNLDNSPSSPLNETWTYDGTNWTLLAPTTKPSARAGARMVFDSAHNIVLMFGGRDGTKGASNHMWKWSGSNWTDAGAAAGPFPDYDTAGLAFDANLGKVVAWDGSSGSTWEWSGTAWTTVSGTTPPVPASSPTFRGYIELTYDAARKQIVMFGGDQGGYIPAFNAPNPPGPLFYADTWVRTGQAWTQPATFAEPSARIRAAAGYDPLRKRTVVFGGQSSSRRKFGCGASGCMLNDTWEWDGSKWTAGSSTGAPAVRAGDQLDYDTSARVLRLYGGDSYSSTGPTDTTYTDVYSYNGAGWTPQSSAGHTSVRASAMAYDANANKLVTFGGVVVANGSASNETWTWSSSGGWVKLAPATPPTARDDAALAYDPVRKRSVLFGGNPRDGSNLTDVYEFDGAAWSRFTTSGPSSRRGLRAFYNPDSARVTFFGNNPGASEDVWEWGVAGWQQRALVNIVAPRYDAAVAYDAANHAIVMFSGRDAASFAPVASTTLVKLRSNVTVEACTSAALDYDGDGLAGCADDDCWSVCTPLCPPGVTCPAGAPKCGDGTCSGFEDCNLCPTDCGACTGGKCGDFHCDGGETHASCPNDC